MTEHDIQKNNMITFTVAPALFFIKGKMWIEHNTLRISVPVTVNGAVQLGHEEKTIPIKKLTGTTVKTICDGRNIAFGLLCLAGGAAITYFLSDSYQLLIAIILFLISILQFISAVKITLVLQKAGSNGEITVPFYERKKIEWMKKRIDRRLFQRAQKQN